MANANERFDLIRENLAEVLNPEIIENILAEGRHPKIYWGMFSRFRLNMSTCFI
jgi:tyrosyl-tRNA synthetase